MVCVCSTKISGGWQ